MLLLTGPLASHRAYKPPLAESADGVILLHSRDVDVHGTKVRYEPQPHKNTVGYWTQRDDWVSWDFVIAKPGTFDVEITQGCGKGSGGSEVEFIVGEQKLAVTVEDTGGFQNWRERKIGSLTFKKPGRYTLEVRAKTKPGVAVMDLQQVKLNRARSEETK